MSLRFAGSPAKSPGAKGSPKGIPKVRLACQIVGETANMRRKGLVDGSPIELPENIKSLLLSDNHLSDFMCVPGSDSVTWLDASRNPLQSLRGFPSFRRLKTADFADTPFSKGMNYRMALILVCPTLTVIDGVGVAPEERRAASAFPPECVDLVRSGWCGSLTAPAPEDIAALRRALAGRIIPGGFRSPRRSPARAPASEKTGRELTTPAAVLDTRPRGPASARGPAGTGRERRVVDPEVSPRRAPSLL